MNLSLDISMKERIKLISITDTSTIRETMWAIDRGAIGLAILVNASDNSFVGLITDGDIRRALLNGFGLDQPAKDIPRPDARTAPADMSADELARIFSDQVRIVPVLNDENRVVDLAIFDKRIRLPVAEPSLGEKELIYVSECVLTGWVSSAGKFVTQFEEMFADFCQVDYAIATSNGTTALHLALLALGIGPGDEVIVPTLTFIATANAVRYTGAQPIFVDSEQETWNLNPEDLESAITRKTKAIIPVHLYGHPANMDPILTIARKYNLFVIEDAAEAHGARYKGIPVGGIGDIGVFSFYGNKIITTGEGGMVVTNDPKYAQTIKILRDHGMSPERKYWHVQLGYNYRMTNIQAALGVAQMERVGSILDSKKQIAIQYNNGLQEIESIVLPPNKEWAENVYWLYSILINEDKTKVDRDQLMNILRDNSIETRPLFHPVHSQPIYKTGQYFPIAEKLSREGISLPSAVTLTSRDIEKTISMIKQALR